MDTSDHLLFPRDDKHGAVIDKAYGELLTKANVFGTALPTLAELCEMYRGIDGNDNGLDSPLLRRLVFRQIGSFPIELIKATWKPLPNRYASLNYYVFDLEGRKLAVAPFRLDASNGGSTLAAMTQKISRPVQQAASPTSTDRHAAANHPGVHDSAGTITTTLTPPYPITYTPRPGLAGMTHQSYATVNGRLCPISSNDPPVYTSPPYNDGTILPASAGGSQGEGRDGSNMQARHIQEGRVQQSSLLQAPRTDGSRVIVIPTTPATTFAPKHVTPPSKRSFDQAFSSSSPRSSASAHRPTLAPLPAATTLHSSVGPTVALSTAGYGRFATNVRSRPSKVRSSSQGLSKPTALHTTPITADGRPTTGRFKDDAEAPEVDSFTLFRCYLTRTRSRMLLKNPATKFTTRAELQDLSQGLEHNEASEETSDTVKAYKEFCDNTSIFTDHTAEEITCYVAYVIKEWVFDNETRPDTKFLAHFTDALATWRYWAAMPEDAKGI